MVPFVVRFMPRNDRRNELPKRRGVSCVAAAAARREGSAVENILQLITSLLGGGANNSLLILVVGAVIFFVMQGKKPPAPKPDPAKEPLQAGILDLLNIDAANMPILAWFAQLPADQQAAFWAAAMKKLGTLGK